MHMRPAAAPMQGADDEAAEAVCAAGAGSVPLLAFFQFAIGRRSSVVR